MAWAATKTSVAAGDWGTAGTWTPAVVPTQNDYVQINHQVVGNVDPMLFAGLYVDGALLQVDPGCDFTVKDAAGTHAAGEHIRISDNAASGIYFYGSKSISNQVRSASATPTYPVKMLIMNKANPDARAFNFDYCELRNFAPSLGNQTNYLFFNTGNVTTDGTLDPPLPIRRDQKIDDIYCEGRSYSRTYPEGGHAGVLELSGLVPWSGYAWQTLNDMRDARSRISYIGEFCTMPKAIIESLRFGRRDGPYIPFNLTLLENR